MTNPNMGNLAKCRPNDRAALLRGVALQVDRLVGEIMTATGWTQLQVAIRLDCSERALLNWRTGDAEPGAARVDAIEVLHAEVAAERRMA